MIWSALGVFLWLVGAVAVAGHEILCRRCGAVISDHEHLLTEDQSPPYYSGELKAVAKDQSQDGIEQVREVTNAVGQSFEVALFKNAAVNSVYHTKSIQDSFFPGYAWQIAECPHCKSFVGWSFDRPSHCHAQVPSEADIVMTESAETVLNRVFARHQNHGCLLKASGYWTMEFCFQKEVTQFHVESAKSRNRDPSYSLGTFTTTREIKADSEMSFHIPGSLGARRYVEQKFENGQKCDETGNSRSSTAILICCVNYHHSLGPINTMFLATIREPALCQYELVVCIPELCPIPGFEPKPPATLASSTEEDSGSLTDDKICSSGIPPETCPSKFYALDWSSLIAEDSADILWTRTIEPILGTGQLK